MKKTILKTVSTSLFLCIVCGCNGNNSSSSSSVQKEKTFSEMIEEISTQNITYRSDYLIYYYPIDEAEEVVEINRYDVTAKITEDAYDMKAYLYGTNNVASYAHLEKDESGYVTYSDIDIHNNLVINRAIDGNNEEFLWEESVYYNLIQYLKVDDFKSLNNETYEYTGDLEELPLNILHTAIPTSYFTIESLKVKIENNAIESFVFQEIESDEAYENHMYGRKVELSFENIGTTQIERVSPYEEKEENIDLGLALEDIRTKTNLTIKSEGILENNDLVPLQDTYITETDILQIQYQSDNYKTGIHTYSDELYLFETVDKYLLGKRTNNKVKDYLPTFDFSEHVFEYLGEREGYKVYRPYSTMKAVLNYIDVISVYEDAYYPPAGDIEFFVKNNKLEKIEFPVFLYSTADYQEVTNRITYTNVGTTTINESIWEDFVLELPSTNATSWNHSSYDFIFEYSANNNEEMNLGDLFTKCLGASDEIPYFIPESSNFSIDGNYSSSDKAVYVTLISLNGIDEEAKNLINDILLGENYSYDEYHDEMMDIYTYIKDDIKVEVIVLPSDEYMEVVITLPVGSLLD